MLASRTEKTGWARCFQREHYAFGHGRGPRSLRHRDLTALSTSVGPILIDPVYIGTMGVSGDVPLLPARFSGFMVAGMLASYRPPSNHSTGDLLCARFLSPLPE